MTSYLLYRRVDEPSEIFVISTLDNEQCAVYNCCVQWSIARNLWTVCTVYIARVSIKIFFILPTDCLYGTRPLLKTNSDCFPKQQQLIAFCNQDRSSLLGSRLRLKRDGTHAETRFLLSAKPTSPFKSSGGVSSVDYWQPRCAHQR